MSTIDQYITELSSCLLVGRRHRARILAEVRDHLDDATTDHERAGDQHEPAVLRALETFGSPSVIARQFNAEAGARAMRRAPIVAATAGAAVLIGLLVAGTSQPRPAVPTSAILATQVSFFVGVLAFQVAGVAGICTASRAVAVWRAPTARGGDRQFVRRAATISTSALGVSATGWAVALGLALDRHAHPDTATALVGGAIMIGAAILAITTTYYLRVNPSDNATDDHAETPSLFSLGERSIALVPRHPVVSCATVAAFSAWPAMAHAETTFTGALPWGIIQAATVVIAFVVLGPALGLRRPHPA